MSSQSEDFLMPIGDVFHIAGRGIVVTGKIERGSVVPSMQVEITHGAVRRAAVVVGIESFHKIVKVSRAGENVGLLLSGIGKDDVAPGYVVRGASSGAAAAAGPSASPPPPPPAIEDPRFAAVEAEYARLRKSLDAGLTTPGEMEAKLSSLMFEHAGRYWTIGANSGDWYASSGGEWARAKPPGRH